MNYDEARRAVKLLLEVVKRSGAARSGGRGCGSPEGRIRRRVLGFSREDFRLLLAHRLIERAGERHVRVTRRGVTAFCVLPELLRHHDEVCDRLKAHLWDMTTGGVLDA